MSISRWTLRAVAILATIAGVASRGAAQGVTTGAISGTITSDAGSGLDQTQVQITNRSTGSRSGVTTRADGGYFVSGLDVGGPYTVSVRRIGYSPKDTNGVFVSLGQTVRIDLKLSTRPSQLEAVTIVASTTSSVITPSHQGTEMTISDSTIARIPTLNRNFTDFVKLVPQISTTGPGNSGAGQNNRFNAIQIDGAVASDLFGLGATGQPGAQANGKQISLEAVKEYQVLLAPFDVRQGSFTGFLVNAVTKSGSNEFHGSGTYATRNEKLERDVPFLRASPFSQTQYGFWLGGPIIHDKLFFSVAPEFQKQNQPASGPYIGEGTPTPPPVLQAGVDSLRTILTQQYGFADPGNSGVVKNENPLGNMFARIDYVNLPFNSRLVARYNYVNAQVDIFSRSAAQLNLSNNGYNFQSVTNNGLIQLFSNFSNGSSNELLTGYTTVRDKRITPITAPFVTISRIAGTTGTGRVSAGTENSSQGNELDQDIFELTDNYTIPWKAHRFTIGTKNEFLKVRNLFGQNSFGNYTYGTLDSLRNNTPSTVTIGLKLDNSDGAARFTARTLGFYGEDEWQATRDLNVTLGLRLDIPGLTSSPNQNPTLLASPLHINTADVPKNVMQWSPRFGFNWDVTGDQTNQLRGGSGVFTGRPAYVWLSNAFGNSGVNGFANLICNNGNANTQAPAMPTTAGQPVPTSCRNATTANPAITLNTVDPNLKFPSVWRSSLGFDRKLPWNIVGTIEGLYTRAVQQFYYQNLGLVDDPIGVDRNGRSLYGDISTGNNLATSFKPGLNNVFNIANSKHEHDYSYSLTGQLQKRFTTRFEGMAAYTYGRSYSVWDVTSSVATSNWQFGRSYAGRQDAEELRPSKFDAPHRVVASGTYSLPTKTDVSVAFAAESGVPFEYVYGTDMNGDGFSSNDLIYVPKDAHDVNEIRFTQLGSVATGLTPAQQADALESYIAGHDCLSSQRGSIMLRNSCRTPWTKHVDLSARQSLPTLHGQNFILQLDVFNFLNLLNKNWGSQDLGSSNSPLLLTRTGFVNGTKLSTTPAAGFVGGAQPTFNFSPTNFTNQFTTQNPQSNYAMQLQLKYSF